MHAQPSLQRSRADRIANALIQQWIWIVVALLAIYAGLPWLSPWLRSLGFERAGQAFFRMYTSFCHQLPERSFFVNGYQVSYCHRCAALYTSLLVFSIAYALGRWRGMISRRMLILLVAPMVVDGLWHMLADLLPTLGLRSTNDAVGSLNFWLRIITATLCSLGVVLWAYPRIQRETSRLEPSYGG